MSPLLDALLFLAIGAGTISWIGMSCWLFIKLENMFDNVFISLFGGLMIGIVAPVSVMVYYNGGLN